MEYVDGYNLYKLIHGQVDAKLTWGLVRQIALEIAAGIEHLHSKKIIHRDIKSLNILVCWLCHFVALILVRLISKIM